MHSETSHFHQQSSLYPQIPSLTAPTTYLFSTKILHSPKNRASPKPSQVMAAPTSISKATGPERWLPLYSFCCFPATAPMFLLKKTFLFFWRIILGYHPSLHLIAGTHNPSDNFCFFIDDISTSFTTFHMTIYDSMTNHHSWSCLFPHAFFIPSSDSFSLTSVPPVILFFTLACNLLP